VTICFTFSIDWLRALFGFGDLGSPVVGDPPRCAPGGAGADCALYEWGRQFWRVTGAYFTARTA